MRSRAERSVVNRIDKRRLLEAGRSHGILVYADGEPVGWCQYGPSNEFPRIDESVHYRGREPTGRTHQLWRITCFVVDKRYRRRGVAGIALAAALEAIRRKGGGLVEGYPITHFRPGTFGNTSTHGTASMFNRAGFRMVGWFGRTLHSINVLMRKTV